MFRKLFGIFVFTLLLIGLSAGEAEAKRVLPRAKSTLGSSGGTYGGGVARTSKGVGAKVQFRGDRRAIIVTFDGLTEVSSVSYSLTYRTRGTNQGVGGKVDAASGNTASRELVFGTASNGVFRYDTGITNARLTVTTLLKNGLKVVKPFRLKV